MQLTGSLGQILSLRVLCVVIIDLGTTNYTEKAVYLPRLYTAFWLVNKHGAHAILNWPLLWIGHLSYSAIFLRNWQNNVNLHVINLLNLAICVACILTTVLHFILCFCQQFKLCLLATKKNKCSYFIQVLSNVKPCCTPLLQNNSFDSSSEPMIL